MQIKITLEPQIAEELDREAKEIGIKLAVYIKLILGQYVTRKEKTV